MSYTPTEWKKGDVITATKLNKMETGIAEANSLAPLLVAVTVTTEDNTTYHTANKTFNEVDTAYSSGRAVVFTEVREYPDDNTTVTTKASVYQIHIETTGDTVSYMVEVPIIGDFYPVDGDPTKNLVYTES